MIRRLATVAATIALLLCPAAAEPRHLRIASEGARPPFNYLDANNQLAGFEIDLTREICRRIEADCVFITQEWESLVFGLENRQYDLVVSAMEINEERLRKIDFSKPYAHTPSALIAQRQSALANADPKTLQGARIGVVADGPQQAYAEDKLKESEVQRYATLEAAMLDLAEGRVDVVAEEKLAAMDFLRERKEGRCCRIIADLPQDAAYFGGGFGYGLRKGATALKSAIDAAIDAIVADGTYRTIRSKYFDFDIR